MTLSFSASLTLYLAELLNEILGLRLTSLNHLYLKQGVEKLLEYFECLTTKLGFFLHNIKQKEADMEKKTIILIMLAVLY